MNQTVLQQVRHIVAQIEAVGSETDTHAVASREILFMQLLVLLRKSSLAEEATNNDARLNQLLALARRPFCAGDLLGGGGGAVFAVAAYAAPPAEAADRSDATALS